MYHQFQDSPFTWVIILWLLHIGKKRYPHRSEWIWERSYVLKCPILNCSLSHIQKLQKLWKTQMGSKIRWNMDMWIQFSYVDERRLATSTFNKLNTRKLLGRSCHRIYTLSVILLTIMVVLLGKFLSLYLSISSSFTSLRHQQYHQYFRFHPLHSLP